MHGKSLKIAFTNVARNVEQFKNIIFFIIKDDKKLKIEYENGIPMDIACDYGIMRTRFRLGLLN